MTSKRSPQTPREPAGQVALHRVGIRALRPDARRAVRHVDLAGDPPQVDADAARQLDGRRHPAEPQE
eukprot:7510850-Pyramimonas_sp.AAC.1